jgi:hypothetical protein
VIALRRMSILVRGTTIARFVGPGVPRPSLPLVIFSLKDCCRVSASSEKAEFDLPSENAANATMPERFSCFRSI